MKKRIIIVKRLAAITTAATLAIAMNVTSFAADKTDLKIDMDGITVDVEKVAAENGVNPYALKQSIEDGMNAEKASPFSSLVTNKPNSIASEDVDISNTTEVSATSTQTKVTKKNQDSTAYVANSGALTASGKTPKIGMCAMHINVTTKTGKTTKDIVRLGTTIHMSKSIKISGKEYSSFVVEDRGGASNRTKFFIDLYFGLNNSTNYNAAINYGVKTVTYYYYINSNS